MPARISTLVITILVAIGLTMIPTTRDALAAGSKREKIVKVRQADGSHRWQLERLVDPALQSHEAAVGGRPVSENVEFFEFAVPNDPGFTDQWNFEQVQISAAWEAATGFGVTVAVLDSGVSPGPDLSCRTFVFPLDTLTGSTTMESVRDLRGHGTHVIGTVAQCTDNAQGFAGTARDATIMPVRVLDDSGSGTSQRIANGILHAVENGADVINLSLGFDCEGEVWPSCGNTAVDLEIEAAVRAGVVVVAAAGNVAADQLAYPANHPLVITVGASDGTGSNTSYSSGGIGLDVLAPGGLIARDELIYQETVSGNGSLDHEYVGKTGTSMAAPHVSGIVAMLLEASPHLSPLAVRCTLIDTAADVGTPGWATHSGWGEVRADSAVTHTGEYFTDVGVEWYEPALSVVVDGGIVDGFGDCTFRPHVNVTRAQSVKLLVVALGGDVSDEPRQIFNDVPTSSWAVGYIERGYDLGWIAGYEDGSFRPGEPISRIGFAVFATRAMGYEPIDSDIPAFTDVSPDDWFHGWLSAAKAHGVINGHADGTFRPYAPVSRAHAATMIYNMLHTQG